MKDKYLKYRVLIVVAGLLLIVFIKIYPCIMLKLSSLPESIRKVQGKKDIVILYGTGLCMSCPPGQYVYSLRNRKDILFVVPGEFEEHDIENIKDVFMLKGTIIKGDDQLVRFIKRISSCKGFKHWDSNFYLKIKKNGKLNSIVRF